MGASGDYWSPLGVPDEDFADVHASGDGSPGGPPGHSPARPSGRPAY
jgi:hypothetical protein